MLRLFNHPAVDRGGSSSTRGLLLVFLSVTRHRRLLGQIVVKSLDHATCKRSVMFIRQKISVETLIHADVTDIVFFIVCKIHFLLVLSNRSIRSKERV